MINSTHIWYCGPFFVWFNLYFIYAAWILSVWHILDLKQPVFDPFYMYSIDTDCLSSFLPVHDLLCTYLIIFYWFNLCVTFSTSLQSIHPAFGQCNMCLAKSTQIWSIIMVFDLSDRYTINSPCNWLIYAVFDWACLHLINLVCKWSSLKPVFVLLSL